MWEMPKWERAKWEMPKWERAKWEMPKWERAKWERAKWERAATTSPPLRLSTRCAALRACEAVFFTVCAE
jgi:hypothetical protein